VQDGSAAGECRGQFSLYVKDLTMKRVAFLLAFVCVLAVPANASAWFFHCWGGPRYGGYGYGGYGYALPYYRPYFVPVYPVYPAVYPTYPVPLAPPSIYPSTPPLTKPKAEAPVVPNRAPVVTVTPGNAPLPKQQETRPMTGAAAPTAAPEPTIPDPMVPVKANGTSDSKPLPIAVPSPAPAPMIADPLPPIQIPESKPKKTDKSNNSQDDLPPLVLPPETPGGPSGVVPPVGPNTSRSSPLTGAVKVQVFEAGGPIPASSLRKIGFFNHTGRDIKLVIEGKAVTLPKKSYLHAELPTKFTWMHSGSQSETATVPAAAAGLDVLFKE
jgi:hypothetical protein